MFFLRDFKNFGTAELSFDDPVTMLVGPNGAGKSNLIEAIELLCFLVSGRPLHEITDLGREGGLELRGGLDACASWGKEEFVLGFQGEVSVGNWVREVSYEITVRTGKEPRIVSEFLRTADRDTPIFEVLPRDADSPSADNLVLYDNFARGGKKPITSTAADRSALSQYARFARNNAQLADTLELIDAITRILAPTAVFDPIPKLMRDYQRESETKLARNGFNISPVLADLFSRRVVIRKVRNELRRVLTDRSEVANRILARIAQLPDEPFTSFDFVRTKADDVMFGFKVAGRSKPIPARVLSDGTLRALAVLTALETSTKGSRIIIEEFDNGVHPSRVQVLTEALFECSERTGLRSLITTHNPATLNALTTAQTGAVLFVAQVGDSRQASLIPIPKLPGYIEFLEQGRLGDLITRRVYEQHLSQDYEAERREEIGNWINNLP